MLARNMASMSALSLYRNAVQFALNILMARFILPAEYGLLVFTAPFLAFLGLMTDLGLSSAIVRSKGLSDRQTSAAFTLTLGLGVALALGLGALAWPIQSLVHMRGLGPVMAAMSGVVLLNVASTVPRALLERHLRYGRIAGIEAGAVLISAACAVLAALLGAGVWALVGYNLLSQLLRAIAYGWLARRELRLEFGWTGLKPLLSFGGWVLATNGLTFFSRNSDNLLIGGVLGSAAVGVYGLGYQFMMIPLMAITWPSSSVMFAMLSRQALHASRVRETVRSVVSATAVLSFPAMIYLTFGLSYPVRLVLSPHWGAVPAIVTWLAPLGALQSIASYSGAVLMAMGKPRVQFLLSLANTVVTVAAFVLTVRFGLFPLIRTYVAVGGAMSLVMLAVTVRSSVITWSDLGRAVAPAALATAAGLAAALLIGRLAGSDASRWAMSTAAFGVVVLGGYGIMFRHMRGSLAALVAPATESIA